MPPDAPRCFQMPLDASQMPLDASPDTPNTPNTDTPNAPNNPNIQLASPRPPRQGRFFEKKNAKSRKFSRATVPVTLLTTLKNLLFRVSLKIANGNGVREQPSL